MLVSSFRIVGPHVPSLGSPHRVTHRTMATVTPLSLAHAIASAEMSVATVNCSLLMAVRMQSCLTATPVIPLPKSSTFSSKGHAAAMRSTSLSVSPTIHMRRKVSRDNLPRSNRVMKCGNSISNESSSSRVSFAPTDLVTMSNKRDGGSGTPRMRRTWRSGKGSKGSGCASNTVGKDGSDRGKAMALQLRICNELGSLRTWSR